MDVSIIELSEGVFEVQASSGNQNIGGEDFDRKIVDWLVSEFKREHGIDLLKEPTTSRRLFEATEKAKIDLSNLDSTNISIPYVAKNFHLDSTLTRAKFEELTHDLIEQATQSIFQVLKDCNIKSGDQIDKVILVGGSTQIPAVQNAVKKYLDKRSIKCLNRDEIVAIGAAIQGGVISGSVRDVLVLDATSYSLGIETFGGVFERVILRNTTFPTKESMEISTSEIHVLQGDDDRSSGNVSICKKDLGEIKKIDLTFDIEADGFFKVLAKDLGTNQTFEIPINYGISESDLNRMTEYVREFAAELKDQHENRKARYHAEEILNLTRDKIAKIDSISRELKQNSENLRILLTDKTSTKQIRDATDTLETLLIAAKEI